MDSNSSFVTKITSSFPLVGLIIVPSGIITSDGIIAFSIYTFTPTFADGITTLRFISEPLPICTPGNNTERSILPSTTQPSLTNDSTTHAVGAMY